MAAIYTPQELAERWKLKSSKTVYREYERGHLRGFKVGDLLRVTEDAVLEYEAARGATPAPITAERQCQPASRPAPSATIAPYAPVFGGAVPWRDEVEVSTTTLASSASGRGRSANKKKAALSGN
jgi:hypothetical protein